MAPFSSSSGFLQAQTLFGEYNNVIFAIQQALAKMQTATLVQIVSCTNDGGVSPVGFVDVFPLVNQIDGNGIGTPRATLYGLPYLRLQGGANAIILDPQPGDIGIAVFASRDISTVVATKKQANPATFRMYDFSDGLYLGGVLNQQPNQYVQFTSSGIAIVSPGTITLQAGNIVLDGPVAQSGGDVSMSGSLTTGGDVVANGVSLDTHVHGGVQTGGGETGAPV